MTLALDTVDMFGVTARLPEQVAAAAKVARGIEGLPTREEIENVVVLGMGGSGVAGDILLATAAPLMPVPVVVVKSYSSPAFVDEHSLVFVISCSGDTEETIEAAAEAAMQGARLVCVTSGGELGRLADEWGAPVVPVPGTDEIPYPRAGLGAMAVPPLVVLEDVGLFPGAAEWIDDAVRQLQRRRDELVKHENPATALARRIGRTIPLVHSANALGAAAAMRWKCQINENANAPAFHAVMPELCHNEIQGWGQHGDATRQLVTIVNLRHDAEHPQIGRRYELYSELVGEVVAGIEDVRAEGDGDLAQLFDLIIFGDFVSLYMAGQEGIDPGPIPALVELKQRLSEG